jgi:hypothetical protein
MTGTLMEEKLEALLRRTWEALDKANGHDVAEALLPEDASPAEVAAVEELIDEVSDVLALPAEPSAPVGAEDPPTEVIGPPADDELPGFDRNACQVIRRPALLPPVEGETGGDA